MRVSAHHRPNCHGSADRYPYGNARAFHSSNVHIATSYGSADGHAISYAKALAERHAVS